ncbi:ABC transporter ATP-binding protein [Brachybacterium sp. GPGPB12]|uniref:ABC transporter ATP-binding protein n=1 Tax=Brachybacterium sp. GPGPB12 TaxID=3023517 RepID=UPI0031342F6E
MALVGTNGAGKTTLMKPLTGLIVPRAGTVTVDGIDTRTRSAAKMADHVSYLYQHPQQMFLKDTVREDIALFPRGRKVPDAEAIVERIIEDVGLSGLADRDGRSLSGGQRRRATLGIGLAMRPSLRSSWTSRPRASTSAPATTSPLCSPRSQRPCGAPSSPPTTWSSSPPGRAASSCSTRGRCSPTSPRASSSLAPSSPPAPGWSRRRPRASRSSWAWILCR